MRINSRRLLRQGHNSFSLGGLIGLAMGAAVLTPGAVAQQVQESKKVEETLGFSSDVGVWMALSLLLAGGGLCLWGGSRFRTWVQEQSHVSPWLALRVWPEGERPRSEQHLNQKSHSEVGQFRLTPLDSGGRVKYAIAAVGLAWLSMGCMGWALLSREITLGEETSLELYGWLLLLGAVHYAAHSWSFYCLHGWVETVCRLPGQPIENAFLRNWKLHGDRHWQRLISGPVHFVSWIPLTLLLVMGSTMEVTLATGLLVVFWAGLFSAYLSWQGFVTLQKIHGVYQSSSLLSHYRCSGCNCSEIEVVAALELSELRRLSAIADSLSPGEEKAMEIGNIAYDGLRCRRCEPSPEPGAFYLQRRRLRDKITCPICQQDTREYERISRELATHKLEVEIRDRCHSCSYDRSSMQVNSGLFRPVTRRSGSLGGSVHDVFSGSSPGGSSSGSDASGGGSFGGGSSGGGGAGESW